MSKAKVSDILSEIFKKIGSKENTKEVGSAALLNSCSLNFPPQTPNNQEPGRQKSCVLLLLLLLLRV